MPKISIIIPIFNTEKYLEQCVSSVINQTLNDIEIICVNDGSTDNSLNILENLQEKDNRIKIINQKNSGQSVARNNGLKIATGKYIAFLDSDDFFDVKMLETLYNLAQKDDTDISMCSINLINEEKNTQTEHDCYFSLDIFPENFNGIVFDYKKTIDFVFKIAVTPWNKIYKSQFLKEKNIKFIEGLNFEDNLFFFETFFQAEKINFTREPLINYRYFSSTSYSTKTGLKDYKKLDFFELFKHQKAFLKKINIYKGLKKNFLAHKKFEFTYWYKKITDKKIKRVFFKKFVILYPQILFRIIFFEFIKSNMIHKINNLTKTKKIMFRGASTILIELLQENKFKHKENILGIIDKNPDKIGTKIFDFKVYDYSILKEKMPDILVLSVENVFNFEKIVKNELQDLNLNISIKSIT